MKNILKFKNIFFVLLLSVFAVSCVDDDYDFGELNSPSNVNVATQVVGQTEEMPYGDGSGEVVFDATADGAITYKYVFENGSSITAPTGVYTHPFSETGINTYTVTVIAYGPGGTASSIQTEVEVLVTYSPPEELIEKLVGKEWRIKSSVPGHFGLGPVGGSIVSEWYGAPPEAKAGVGMYDDRYIFEEDNTFVHIVDATNDDPERDPSGTIVGRVNLLNEIASCPTCETQSDGNDIINVPYTDYTETWSISAPNGVETINITGNGFIGYYIGGDHKYQIFDRSGTNEIILKSTDGNGEFDWWFILTSTPEGTQEPEEFETQYNDLVWEQDFESGSLDTDIWNIETGNNNGWGNNEKQYYTGDNVTVEDGNLVITARAESESGFDYTSSRITTKDNFEFTYGRVEVRAKLPGGGGVWPAIWMLGGNFDDVSWPAAGEIDIMEYVGNNPGEVLATVHYPGNSGGNGISGSTNVDNPETEFHLYSLEWTPEKLYFLIDDEVFHTVDNSADLPFNQDFFLILNVAMGGNLGGEIDASFTESSMVIDYVKVFQAEE
jgi:hypothetical protein